MEDFKYEYILGKNVSIDPMFPLCLGYIFTHQFTLGEYIVTFEDILHIFTVLLDENDKLFYNTDNNEIILRLFLPVTKEDIETVNTVLNRITTDSEIKIDGHYILIKINNLLNITENA